MKTIYCSFNKEVCNQPKKMMELTENYVVSTMSSLIGIGNNDDVTRVTKNRMMKVTFGFSPNVVLSVFNHLIKTDNLPEKGRLVHLLWLLTYMKSYEPLEVYCCRYSVSRNTFTKWVGNFAKAISNDKIVVSIYII